MLGSRSWVAHRLGSDYSPHLRLVLPTACWLLALLPTSPLTAQQPAVKVDREHCRKQLIAGNYLECIREAHAAIQQRSYGEDWPVLKARAELATGRYGAAKASVAAGLKRYSWSIQLRLLGYHAALHTGDNELAAKRLTEIDQLAANSLWRYSDAADLVTLGKTALILGADARIVLEGFFDRAKKFNAKHRAPYLGSGQLALDKHDFELAADIFAEAAKKIPDDPDILFGLAKASASGDSKRAEAALNAALKLNPNHVPSLLFQADRMIDSERYADAELKLQQVLKINPRHPEAWAYRAILAYLENDARGETAFRDVALSTWRENPAVDHLIGRKLSQKYRFAEGADYQRRSLAFAAGYLPAKIQLSQDLLRLGQEESGWTLAEDAHESDGYDTATFNLIELRDRIAKFRTLKNDDFIVRMEAREAAIYGQRVLKLLGRAKKVLCAKYGLELKDPITVEIFPEENDFAVRTFGMPAVSGFLGVCFGKVITANSPASQGDSPSNWESVLWHEFCHVVTLELTRNKMPRWLSEGISVYEELQENRNWGQRMTPRYREMILGGELTPIGKLSSAFLSAKSSLHIQFAYYESALAVEFLIDRYGIEALKHILHDLGAGLPINVALERHTDLLGKLEQDFEQFAKQRAESLAPKADWEKPDLAALVNDDGNALEDWVKDHPANIYALTAYAQVLLIDEEWEKAKKPLRKLLELYPQDTASDNAALMLAAVHRKLDETKEERAVLKEYAAIDADAVPVYLRLIETETAAGNWQAVLENAERLLAVNPLITKPHQALAAAAGKLKKDDTAITAYRTLLEMEPDDPAEVHYRLARLLYKRGDSLARRHVLLALEEAPRFRDAHRLLLQLTRGKP